MIACQLLPLLGWAPPLATTPAQAKFGFYGRPMKDLGGRSYDCECGSDCTKCPRPDYRCVPVS